MSPPACPTSRPGPPRAPHLVGQSISSFGFLRPGLFILLHSVLAFGAALFTRWLNRAAKAPGVSTPQRGVPAQLANCQLSHHGDSHLGCSSPTASKNNWFLLLHSNSGPNHLGTQLSSWRWLGLEPNLQMKRPSCQRQLMFN